MRVCKVGIEAAEKSKKAWSTFWLSGVHGKALITVLRKNYTNAFTSSIASCMEETHADV